MKSPRGVRVVGSGLAQLAHHQSNAELSELLGMSAADIERMSGVRARYVGGPSMDLPTLHALACKEALGDGGPPDLILNASVGFHQLIPDTTIFIQRALGLEGIPGFSMHGTCLSFLYALQVADAYLRAGLYRRILVSSAELNSRVRNFAEPESAALLGDAGAAVVLEACDEPQQAGVLHCSIQAWPQTAELTQLTGFGLRKHPMDPETKPSDYLFTMDGSAVLKAASRRFLQHMNQFWDRAALSKDEIDLVIPHQPSGSGLRFLERYGFPSDKVINILPDYGNCAAVSMPLALAIARREGRLRVGDKVLFVGTGAGLAVGAIVFQWA
jgi:3-oxoacyl-[acyl-carrier-protein] synthase-3